jgi:cytochrome oxidase assembly protein ShyY1
LQPFFASRLVSNVQHPVPATPEQMAQELAAARRAAAPLCPLHIVLDRVVVSPAGVVLACWQVARGTEPSGLRAALQVQTTPPLHKAELAHRAAMSHKLNVHGVAADCARVRVHACFAARDVSGDTVLMLSWPGLHCS